MFVPRRRGKGGNWETQYQYAPSRRGRTFEVSRMRRGDLRSEILDAMGLIRSSPARSVGYKMRDDPPPSRPDTRCEIPLQMPDAGCRMPDEGDLPVPANDPSRRPYGRAGARRSRGKAQRSTWSAPVSRSLSPLLSTVAANCPWCLSLYLPPIAAPAHHQHQLRLTTFRQDLTAQGSMFRVPFQTIGVWVTSWRVFSDLVRDRGSGRGSWRSRRSSITKE
jgi:hypothetical protein